MKYQYSVIGDNTQENREWLERLGYKPNMIDEGDNMLYTREYFNGWMYSGCPYMKIPDSYINCIGNSPLFKAVSAMREDSDYGQLFECKDGLFICQYETSREHIDKECKGWDITNLKKYNLEELQERFKEKER